MKNPGGPSVLVIVTKYGLTLSAGLRRDNLQQTHDALTAALKEVSEMPAAQTKIHIITNTDENIPILAVDMRWVSGWYFFTPSDANERLVAAQERAADAVGKITSATDEGEEWKKSE